MKVYVLKSTCPYYGDIEDEGVFSSKENAEKAIEILSFNRHINYKKRCDIETVELDVMPYDRRNIKETKNEKSI